VTRVLVVEDDPDISEALAIQLGKAGYEVVVSGSGPAGWSALTRERPDAVLLDLSLPGMSGTELLAGLRSGGSEIAVLAVTAESSIASLVRVLELGADDYIVKPFRGPELIARLRAALRRVAPEGDPSAEGVRTLAWGSLTLDLTTHAARAGRTLLELSRTEVRLLEALLGRPNEFVPAETLVARVWESAAHLDPSTLRVNLHRLRAKLDAAHPGWGSLRSARGIGWGLFPPQSQHGQSAPQSSS
jgi:DNA-binding response OmpR family regulator